MKWLKNTFFFFFQSPVFLIFVKIWTSVFIFYFWLLNLLLEELLELLEAAINCMMVFQGLNFDPVKEILKICYIYILMNKVITLMLWGKFMGKWSLLLHHRKKLNWFITYSIRIGNLDWYKCQKETLEVFCKKKLFFKM